ncbi:MAG: pili assembly chaperone [Methyloprofundus sp.]|nr:pili assembly chaperone [Methyloprofundus sp.]
MDLKKTLKVVLSIGLMSPALVMAASGTGGTEFVHAKNTATAWLTGDLGIAIATAGGIWGMIAAVAGNIKMAGLGVGIAAVAALSAPVIETIFTATI